MNHPLVSVVLPSYNHEKFLAQRIESILSQTFQDFELIILDDVSPDNSKKIIEKYRDHPKVSQIIYNLKNSGSTFSQWNKAIFEFARGEFIWIAESDDYAEPTLLEKLVESITSQENIGIAYCQSHRVDSQGNITGDWLDHTDEFSEGQIFHYNFTMKGLDYLNKFLVHKNTIPNASAVVFKKILYIKAGGAQVDLKTNGDWQLWFKLLLLSDVAYISESLNYFRYHNASVIAKETTCKGNKIELKKKLFEYDCIMRNSIEKEIIKCGFQQHSIFFCNQKIKKKNNYTITKVKIISKLKAFF